MSRAEDIKQLEKGPLRFVTISGFPIPIETSYELYDMCPTFAFNPEILKELNKEYLELNENL